MRVLIIEDDARARRLAQTVLAGDGLTVQSVATGEEGILEALVNPYDLILLDLGLPDRSGVLVLRELRRRGCSAPIIVLTGRSEDAEVVQALDAGADDYLVKPVSGAVLRARVRAAVRRGGARRSETLTCGTLVLNRLTRTALIRGEDLQLTAREFSFLETLALHAGEVVTRTDLLEHNWDANFDPRSNVVEAQVARIRRKLRAAGGDVPAIRTIARSGYMLVARDSPSSAGTSPRESTA